MTKSRLGVSRSHKSTRRNGCQAGRQSRSAKIRTRRQKIVRRVRCVQRRPFGVGRAVAGPLFPVKSVPTKRNPLRRNELAWHIGKCQVVRQCQVSFTWHNLAQPGTKHGAKLSSLAAKTYRWLALFDEGREIRQFLSVVRRWTTRRPRLPTIRPRTPASFQPIRGEAVKYGRHIH